MTLISVISLLAVVCLVEPVTAVSPIRAAAPPPRPSGCRAGFSVRKAETGRLRTGQKVSFEDVLTNMGGWQQSTNDFEAPCTGVYFFTFHAVSPENGDFTVALMKGTDFQVTAYGGKVDYQHGSNSALLLLNAGERVHLELQQGAIYEHPFNEAYTTFTGFLLEPF